MHPVKLNPITKTYIVCPDCGKDDGFQISHLFSDAPYSFGPWWCSRCGIGINGKVLSPDSVHVELHKGPRQKKGLMLVKIAYDGHEEPNREQVYLVFDHPITPYHQTPEGDIQPDALRSWVDEYTCPTNILPAEAILFEQDADPHGILRYVQHVVMPDDFEDDPPQVYSEWCMIFDKLAEGVTIDGTVSPAIKRITNGT